MAVKEKEISIVIPVYNAEQTIKKLIERLVPVMQGTNRVFEIVLVNDGSKDNSWSVLSELHQEYGEYLHIIDLMRNYGQHNAIMCGFRQSEGSIVITMDDDLQNPPEEVPKLLQAIEEKNYDLVYGVYAQKEHQPWRNIGSYLSQVFYRRVFHRQNQVTAFRGIKRQLIDCVLSYSLNYTYLDGLFAWNTDRIGEANVSHRPREEGRSGYSLRKLITLALNLFTNFSLVPLQVVSLLGLLFAFGGFSVGSYFIFLYFANNITVPGYASTIVAISFLGGIQLLAIGVIGEYLGRVHLNINRKPQYSLRQERRTLKQI